MEFYLPSLFIIILAFIVLLWIIPKFTPLGIAIIACILLFIGIYSHYFHFYNEYRNMNWANNAITAMASPYLLIGVVILLSLGYILMIFSSGKVPSLPMPSRNIPPPSTATNVVTREIGNGLVNAGVANISPPSNTAERNALESALSKRV
jgi:hypothetical protein